MFKDSYDCFSINIMIYLHYNHLKTRTRWFWLDHETTHVSFVARISQLPPTPFSVSSLL